MCVLHVICLRSPLTFLLLQSFRPGNEKEQSSDQPLLISMLPLLRDGDVVLIARPDLTSPWVNAWHLSLYPWETQRLAQLDAADNGQRKQTLKILKAVCRLNPALCLQSLL